jgi:hypothetical protein
MVQEALAAFLLVSGTCWTLPAWSICCLLFEMCSLPSPRLASSHLYVPTSITDSRRDSTFPHPQHSFFQNHFTSSDTIISPYSPRVE